MKSKMVLVFLIIFAFLFSAALLTAQGDQEESTANATQGTNNTAVMAGDMSVEAEVQGDLLSVTMSAPTAGWLAVGFNPSSMMKDANIIIGYVSGSEVTVEDHFGVSGFAHKDDRDLDGTKDASAVSGEETDSGTVITFTIPLSSGDEYDTELVPGETVTIICAYGKSDNIKQKHSFRDSAQLLIQ